MHYLRKHGYKTCQRLLSYATVKIWIAVFKRGKYSDEKHRRPFSVAIPENINAVHDLILSNRRIWIKHRYLSQFHINVYVI